MFSKKRYILYFFLGFFIIAFPSYYFMNPELLAGNMGKSFFYAEVILSLLISILFWFFLAVTIYKADFFSPNRSALWVTGGFLWILVSWCPACSITLASYLGLASLISLLPYYGLELKVLWVVLILFAVISSLRNLEVCKLKK